MDWLDRLNLRYDRMQEPHRFLLFISIMAIAVLPLQIGLVIANAPLAIFGMVTFSIMVALAMLRAFRMSGKHSYVAVGMGVLAMLVAIGTVIVVS